MNLIFATIMLFLINFSALAIAESYETLQKNGVAKHDNDEYDDAIIFFTKAIELKPDAAISYINRGVCKYKLSKYNEAINDLSIGIEFEPNDKKIYYFRGLSNYELKKYDDAIEDFNKVIELSPDIELWIGSKWAYYYRGLSKNKVAKYTEAMEDFSKTLDLNPGYLDKCLNENPVPNRILCNIASYRNICDGRQVKQSIKKALNEIGMCEELESNPLIITSEYYCADIKNNYTSEFIIDKNQWLMNQLACDLLQLWAHPDSFFAGLVMEFEATKGVPKLADDICEKLTKGEISRDKAAYLWEHERAIILRKLKAETGQKMFNTIRNAFSLDLNFLKHIFKKTEE